MQEEVGFPSGGTLCRGSFYQPFGAGPHPTIVMAPGFGMTCRSGMKSMARAFARAGYAVLAFDYRHFGDSDGEPRQVFSFRRQRDDWDAAIRFARERSVVDPAMIYTWGFSLGGGHALSAASRDPDVRGVIAVAPMFDGLSSTISALRYWRPVHLLTMLWRGVLDVVAAVFRRQPVTVPIVAAPGELGILTSPDALEGFRALVPYDFRYDISARAVLGFWTFRPGKLLAGWSRPTLVIAADQDRINPAKQTRRLAERGRGIEVVTLEAEHLELMLGPYREAVIAQSIDFLVRTGATPRRAAADEARASA